MVGFDKDREVVIGTASNGTWLISFADLLTLLLCAFILYFSQMKPEDRKPDKELGTQVAQIPDKKPLTSIEFYANDVLENGGFLNDERIKVVKNAVDLGFYEGERISVSICQGAFSKELASNFLTLFREVGVPDERMNISFFGTRCSDLGVKGDERGEVAARLTIIRGV